MANASIRAGAAEEEGIAAAGSTVAGARATGAATSGAGAGEAPGGLRSGGVGGGTLADGGEGGTWTTGGVGGTLRVGAGTRAGQAGCRRRATLRRLEGGWRACLPRPGRAGCGPRRRPYNELPQQSRRAHLGRGRGRQGRRRRRAACRRPRPERSRSPKQRRRRRTARSLRLPLRSGAAVLLRKRLRRPAMQAMQAPISRRLNAGAAHLRRALTRRAPMTSETLSRDKQSNS